MTELERACEDALYQEVENYGEGKSLVMDVPSRLFYFRKILSSYDESVYRYLKEHTHPNLVRIVSFHHDDDDLIVLEEFLHGVTLESLDPENLSFSEKKRILCEICDGLDFLHSAEPPIIHRDLKASNIMITADRTVKIIDYDAAKTYDPSAERDEELMGTPGVAAPEQYGFAQSDPRTDVYALGLLIRRLFPNHKGAEAIAAKATQIEPDKRYSSVRAVKRQLEKLTETAGRLTRRAKTAILLALFVLLAAAAGTYFLWYRPAKNEAAAVKEASAAAISEIMTYKDPSEYRLAEQQKLEQIVQDGILAINEADTLNEVQIALSRAEIMADNVKTNRQLLKEEGVIRISGENRYQTAMIIADRLKELSGKAKFENIILIGNRAYADAASGSALALAKNAPILLIGDSAGEDAQKEVLAYIRENLSVSGTVYVLGGPRVIPDEWLTGLTFTRIAADNRVLTNLAVLQEAGVTGGEILVVASTGTAAAICGAASGLPILLVDETLKDEQKAFLSGLSGVRFTVLGSAQNISNDVMNELLAYGDVSPRVTGDTRFSTSAAIARRLYPAPEALLLVRGDSYSDAATAAVLAARMGAPLLLVMDENLNTAAAYAAETGAQYGCVMGGTDHISDASVRKVFRLARNQAVKVYGEE